MNIFKKLKLLKALNNKTSIFYRANKKWFFETEIKDPIVIALAKEWLNYDEKKGRKKSGKN